MRLTTEIETCYLRNWEESDIQELSRIANDRDIWRNLADRFPHPYTREHAESWVKFAREPSQDIHLAIEFRNKVVGGIGIIAGEGIRAKTGEFGYWIAKEAWGHGLATAAGKCMVAHAASLNRFARLEAAVFEWNPASMRVLEKIGFEKEGVLKRSVYKDGKLIDSVLYALLIR